LAIGLRLSASPDQFDDPHPVGYGWERLRRGHRPGSVRHHAAPRGPWTSRDHTGYAAMRIRLWALGSRAKRQPLTRG
jgi:hypothetical protein